MIGEMKEEGKEEERTKYGAKKRQKQRGMQRRRRRRRRSKRDRKKIRGTEKWVRSQPAIQVLTPKGYDSISKDQSQGFYCVKTRA